MESNGSRWSRPEWSKKWIALDGEGRVHGRWCSTEVLSRPNVFGLVRSLLPEVSDLQLVSWNTATADQRIEACQYRPFTPLVCAKLGLRPPPEAPPRSDPSPPPPAQPQIVQGLPPYRRNVAPHVERWANKLQKHFAAGGGR